MGVIGVIGRICRVCWGAVRDVSTMCSSGRGGRERLPNALPRCYGTGIRGASDGYE